MKKILAVSLFVIVFNGLALGALVTVDYVSERRDFLVDDPGLYFQPESALPLAYVETLLITLTYFEPLIDTIETWDSVTYDDAEFRLDGYTEGFDIALGYFTCEVIAQYDWHPIDPGDPFGDGEYLLFDVNRGEGPFDSQIYIYEPILTPVPEPVTLSLLTFGTLALLRKRK